MKPTASTKSHVHRMPFLQGVLPVNPAQLPHDIIAGCQTGMKHSHFDDELKGR